MKKVPVLVRLSEAALHLPEVVQRATEAVSTLTVKAGEAEPSASLSARENPTHAHYTPDMRCSGQDRWRVEGLQSRKSFGDLDGMFHLQSMQG